MPGLGKFGGGSVRGYRGGKRYIAPSGQQAYTSQGMYSWTCPLGVYNVSVVCVGAGGGGGGGGGGLGWRNNIQVSPGQTYTVSVGQGGNQDTRWWGGDSYFGRGSSSVFFNGTSNWVAAAANTATSLGTSNFTIEGWVYTRSLAVNQVVIEQAVIDEGNGNNTGWLIYINTSGQVVFGGAGGQTYITGGPTWPNPGFLGRWTHIALVRSSSTLFTLYINGTSVGTYTSSIDMSSALTARPDTPTLFGSHEMQLAGSWMNGYLSDFRIVKGTAVYTGNFTPPTSNLTAIAGTGLLVFQSSSLVDTSGNGIALSTTFGSYSGGSPSVSEFGPFPLVGGRGGTTAGGTYFGAGGGNGGNRGGYGAGGGAGGYSGNGGTASGGYGGGNGSGGGGGSGANNGDAYGGGGGGGVGILGEGSSGTGGYHPSYHVSTGGSGGSGGSGGGSQDSPGGPYGGSYGGGGGATSQTIYGGGDGAGGAVRIIWAGENVTRAFPSTNTGNL